MARAVRRYDRNEMNHNWLHAASLYKRGRKHFCELYGLYQEQDISGSTSFSAFLHTAPSANETATTSMERMFFDTMRLHEYDIRNKAMKWRAHNERWQQRLVRSVEKFLTSTAPASIVGSVISQNVIPRSRFSLKRINKGSAPADGQESVIVNLDENYILPIEQPPNRQCMASSVGST